MAKKAVEKRLVKSYKVIGSVYESAKVLAKANKTTVANMVENFLIIKTKKR